MRQFYNCKWKESGEYMLLKKTSNRISCPQCGLAAINGVISHETGCPNSGARYDTESGEWIKQRTCFICGFDCDIDDLCCNAPDETLNNPEDEANE